MPADPNGAGNRFAERQCGCNSWSARCANAASLAIVHWQTTRTDFSTILLRSGNDKGGINNTALATLSQNHDHREMPANGGSERERRNTAPGVRCDNHFCFAAPGRPRWVCEADDRHVKALRIGRPSRAWIKIRFVRCNDAKTFEAIRDAPCRQTWRPFLAGKRNPVNAAVPRPGQA